MTAPTAALPAGERRMPSIAVPLVLISVGLLLLFANIGALRGISWSELFRLWPVLLILAGVDVLLRPRSFVAAAIVEVTIVVAAFLYLLSGATLGPTSLAYSLDVPLTTSGGATVTDLDLTMNYGGGQLTLSGGCCQLVSVRSGDEDVTKAISESGTRTSVTITSEANAFFGVDNRSRQWDVKVSSDVPTGLTLNLGAGDFDVRMSTMKVSRATINAGASNLDVTLPRPSGNVPMTISSGASSVTIFVPSGVEYSVKTTGVLHSVTGQLQSPGYATASDRVTIEVSIAAGSLTIR